MRSLMIGNIVYRIPVGEAVYYFIFQARDTWSGGIQTWTVEVLWNFPGLEFLLFPDSWPFPEFPM